MAMVSISEAAKLAGISRSYFHRKYIKQGIVSVSSSPKGKKQIDTSELLRVFGKLHNLPSKSRGSQAESTQHEGRVHSSSHVENGQSVVHSASGVSAVNNRTLYQQEQAELPLAYNEVARANEIALKAENESLRRQLRETHENTQRLRDEFLDREAWYRQQIGKQDDKVKLLEHQYIEQLVSPKWWQFWK